MMQKRRDEIRDVENILETWWNKERSRNGSCAWRHQNEQTHVERAIATIPRSHPGPWTPICYRGPQVDFGAQLWGLWPGSRGIGFCIWALTSCPLHGTSLGSKEDHSGKITINYQFFGVIVGVSVNAAFCNLLKYFNSVYGCDRRACLHLSLCKHDLSPIQQNLCKAHCFSNSKSCKSHFLCECFTCHREGEVEHNIPKILSENVWKICLASASFNRWGEGW